MQEPADQEVELVQPQPIDAGPLAAHGEQEDGEVVDGEREREGVQSGGEAVDELRLVERLVGVPHAVEDSLPELPHVLVGDRGLLREPCAEEGSQGAVADGLLAGGELLYQGFAVFFGWGWLLLLLLWCLRELLPFHHCYRGGG